MTLDAVAAIESAVVAICARSILPACQELIKKRAPFVNNAMITNRMISFVLNFILFFERGNRLA